MADKSSRTFAAGQACRVVDRLVDDTVSMMSAMLDDPWRYADTVVGLDDAGVPAEEFSDVLAGVLSAQEYRTLVMVGQMASSTPGEDLVVLSRWSRHRVVYCVDPDLAAALLATDGRSGVIPAEVLTRLPHPDPLVVLPRPMRWVNSLGQVESYEAFVVTGVRPERRRASSHADDVVALTLHFLGRVLDPVTLRPVVTMVPSSSGALRAVHQVVGMRVVTPLVDASLEQRSRWAFQDMCQSAPAAMLGFADRGQALAMVEEMTRMGLSLLMYLVSDAADVEPDPGPVRRRRVQAGSMGPGRAAGKVLQVGFRVGAGLRAHQGRAAAARGAAAGRTVAAHVRRAHWHTFRVGPGRTGSKVRWVAPTVVNWSGPPDVTTVHVH